MKNSKLKELTDKFEQEKSVLQRQAKSLFVEASKELFDEYPELKSFGWTQYAPYFNDGNPCVFSVNGDSPTINGYDTGCDQYVGVEGEEDGEYEESEDGPTKEQEKLHMLVLKPIARLISTLPRDIMEEIFGADTRVTITRSGKVINGETNHD